MLTQRLAEAPTSRADLITEIICALIAEDPAILAGMLCEGFDGFVWQDLESLQQAHAHFVDEDAYSRFSVMSWTTYERVRSVVDDLCDYEELSDEELQQIPRDLRFVGVEIPKTAPVCPVARVR